LLPGNPAYSIKNVNVNVNINVYVFATGSAVANTVCQAFISANNEDPTMKKGHLMAISI
jgi:hypothetical protein